MAHASADLGRAATASGVFGAYATAMGVALMVAPNLLLPVFGFPPTSEVWPHVAGLLGATLGLYYLYAGWVRDLHFFRVSLVGRTLFCCGMVGFFLAGLGGPALAAFGLVDLAGAGWTLWALQSAGAVEG